MPKVRGSSAGLTRLNYLAANGPLTYMIHWAQKLNKPRGADSAGKRSTDLHNSYCGPNLWALHGTRANLTRHTNESENETRKREKKRIELGVPKNGVSEVGTNDGNGQKR